MAHRQQARPIETAIATLARKHPNLSYGVMELALEGSGKGAARKYAQGRHAIFGFRMR